MKGFLGKMYNETLEVRGNIGRIMNFWLTIV